MSVPAPQLGSLGSAFRGATVDDLTKVASRASARRVEPGTDVVREGELAEALWVVEEGQLEVWTERMGARVHHALLGPGQVFGELGVVGGDRRRRATVTALTPVRLWEVARADVDRLVEEVPSVAAALATLTRLRTRLLALRHVAALRGLPAAAFVELAELADEIELAEGEILLVEGTAGGDCYVVVSGGLVVARTLGGGETREVGRVGPGELVGELGAITGAPRNATVHALEASRLLRLEATDLTARTGVHAGVSDALSSLLRARVCPRRVEGVSLHERVDARGVPIFLLKGPQGAFFQLSERGRVVWDRLDGRHDLRGLTLAVLRARQGLAPDFIERLVGELARAGLVLLPNLDPGVGRAPGAELSVVLREVDGVFTRLHRVLGRPLLSRIGRVGIAASTVVGLAAFAHAHLGADPGWASAPWRLLLLAWPLTIVSVVLHEVAHGVMVKAAGREVLGVGVGWYWFGPVVFVDTSDMWLADRPARAAVALAGPVMNLWLGGLASLAAVALHGELATVAWLTAAANYGLAFGNLNPALEYDGYYLLMDLLDAPNLRRRSLRWLRTDLGAALAEPRRLWEHRREVVYGVSSVAFVVATVAVTLGLHRWVLAARLAAWTGSPAWGEGLALGLGLCVAAIAARGLWHDLEGASARDTVG